MKFERLRVRRTTIGAVTKLTANRYVLPVATLVASLIPICANNQGPGLRSSESSWVQGGDYRLHANVFTGDKVSEKPVLVAVLHGDAPRNPSCPTKECGEPDYQDAFAAQAATGRDVIAVGLLRPGYTDPRGNTSDGVRGDTTGDNYNAGTPTPSRPPSSSSNGVTTVERSLWPALGRSRHRGKYPRPTFHPCRRGLVGLLSL